ncbi:antitoxin VapB family protein [Halegenticoccus tardaugens]|uniref:antitoxin VapB family protein n=1 Tax=Halegenticoccus tardaugens TaxID=2071624 RepID=UPI00100BE9CF|nr:antitoxin VapB family protein [Halegenticoccus tardaugens]
MGTKNISLTEEAYETLKARKRPNESFTDVVLREFGGEKDVWKGFGKLEGMGLREAFEEQRAEFDRDFDEKQDELLGQ